MQPHAAEPEVSFFSLNPAGRRGSWGDHGEHRQGSSPSLKWFSVICAGAGNRLSRPTVVRRAEGAQRQGGSLGCAGGFLVWPPLSKLTSTVSKPLARWALAASV